MKNFGVFFAIALGGMLLCSCAYTIGMKVEKSKQSELQVQLSKEAGITEKLNLEKKRLNGEITSKKAVLSKLKAQRASIPNIRSRPQESVRSNSPTQFFDVDRQIVKLQKEIDDLEYELDVLADAV